MFDDHPGGEVCMPDEGESTGFLSLFAALGLVVMSSSRIPGRPVTDSFFSDTVVVEHPDKYNRDIDTTKNKWTLLVISQKPQNIAGTTLTKMAIKMSSQNIRYSSNRPL